MTGMNQAFVKETDAETQEFRDDARHRKNLEDWLVIQEKKLAVLLEKGKASFNAVCAACHAADGNSTIAANPVLAQQHPEYIIKQLQEFKENKRKGTVMAGFAAPLSDEDMRNIAYFVHSQKAKHQAATNKDTLALGEKIWRGGIASRGVPACAACHAPNGAGMPIKYPRLAGQHAGYTDEPCL